MTHSFLPAALPTLLQRWVLILPPAGPTLAEIVLGRLTGLLLGVATALTMSYFRPARRWLLPVLVVSQAIPVFAIAPLLVLWLGYGMPSKAAMRSEEHTSELQSLMRISYAVFCLKKKNNTLSSICQDYHKHT